MRKLPPHNDGSAGQGRFLCLRILLVLLLFPRLFLGQWWGQMTYQMYLYLA